MSTKSEVLKMLEQKKGSFLRGEELAQQMQVSRTAVWKAVKGLREEGYEILSVKNRGYALGEKNDILSEEAIRLWLKKQEAEVEIWKEIPSTNQRLKQAAMEKKLLLTQRQRNLSEYPALSEENSSRKPGNHGCRRCGCMQGGGESLRSFFGD